MEYIEAKQPDPRVSQFLIAIALTICIPMLIFSSSLISTTTSLDHTVYLIESAHYCETVEIEHCEEMVNDAVWELYNDPDSYDRLIAQERLPSELIGFVLTIQDEVQELNLLNEVLIIAVLLLTFLLIHISWGSKVRMMRLIQNVTLASGLVLLVPAVFFKFFDGFRTYSDHVVGNYLEPEQNQALKSIVEAFVNDAIAPQLFWAVIFILVAVLLMFIIEFAKKARPEVVPCLTGPSGQARACPWLYAEG
jgi:hypothetical protein